MGNRDGREGFERGPGIGCVGIRRMENTRDGLPVPHTIAGNIGDGGFGEPVAAFDDRAGAACLVAGESVMAHGRLCGG